MAYLTFDNIKIAGISACVPKIIDKISDHTDLFTEEELMQFTKQVGIAERRFADSQTCTSDLCVLAAEKLIESMAIDKQTIDLIVLVTQTSDYVLPASSILIQNRLKLSKTTAAFDVNLGCSGYVYGLSIVYSFLQQQNFRKALLLVGDTSSKAVNPNDRVSCLLFGDSGTATIIEKDKDSDKSYFSLNSDGAGYEAIIIRGGGFRHPFSEETLKNVQYEDGSVRCANNLSMNGPDVFNFTIREIPKSIMDLLAFANLNINDTDYLVYHQANKFIIDFLTKKLKYPKEKVPYSLTKFGNTSGASIPITILTELRNQLNSKKKLILSGFGVGLSWANAIVDIENCHMPELLEL
jgi:3-oxoacyl-[acyl-carrier-protein] synthase III